MRRILLGFMTLLIITPVLTCVMMFCVPESAQAAEPQPCHQSAKAQKDNPKSGPMFALDCMSVDLFQPGIQADIVQPDLSVDHIDFVWADIASSNDFLLTFRHFIRGPPFDTSPPHFKSTGLYLITQRLRI